MSFWSDGDKDFLGERSFAIRERGSDQVFFNVHEGDALTQSYLYLAEGEPLEPPLTD